ncbi:MAG: sialidase family protein [Planctomycetales bacterium]
MSSYHLLTAVLILCLTGPALPAENPVEERPANTASAASPATTTATPRVDEPNAKAPHDVVVYSNGHRIPAIVLTKKGTLLAFAEHRLQSSDHGNVDLVVKRSSDGGKTWGEQILIHDAGSVASGNPCPVVDRDTDIVWLGFASNNNKLAMITYSKDDGLNWAKPTDITKQAKLDHWGWYAFGPCHGIQLKNGRLILHGNHHCPKGKGSADPDPQGTHGHVVYSDDHGKTWRMGGVVPGHTSGESSVTESSDGSLYWNARSQGAGRRAVSRSADGGLTWSDAVLDSDLTEPKGSGGCQGNAIRFTDEIRHKQNRLLFCNPADTKDRKDLTVYLSYDEAKTWQKCKVVKKGSASYNDLVILPDLSIGCLYETNDGAWQRIRFARFTLDWLTDGKDRIESKSNGRTAPSGSR